MVQDQRQRQADQFRMDHGEGVTMEVGGVKVTYNGDNTSGVDNAWMRRVRDDLVSSGTIFVDPKAKLPPQLVSAALMQDTDRAAKQAVLAMRATGTTGEAAFKLFTGLTLSADMKDPTYQRLARAMKERNPNAAATALAATPLYRQVPGPRKAYLMANLNNAMKD
jgi:hypothetical protein